MLYQTQKRRKNLFNPSLEEEEIQLALRKYKDGDLVDADPSRFTPTSVLYEAYLQQRSTYDPSAASPELLPIQAFGAAVRFLYDVKRVQRTVNGYRTWGYIGLDGPGTITVYAHAGQPSKDNKARTTAAQVQAGTQTVTHADTPDAAIPPA